MRRLALAAVLGALVLTACNDQSKETPTEPTPSFKVAPVPYDCSTSPWVLNSLAAIFPGGKGKTLLSSAQDKINAIILSCQSGKLADAQKKAMYFDDWMFKKFQANLLITSTSTPDDVFNLFIAVLQGVGIDTSFIKPDLVTSDAGTGVFEPGVETTVFTALYFAALRVPSNGFDETTLLIVDKLPNNTHLNNAQAFVQFPPFYDFNAVNASNQHVLSNNQLAHVEMCFYPTDYPPGVAIGHNPVFGAPGYPFEVLPSDELHLLDACVGIPPVITLVTPSGLQGLAVSAWQAAKQSMSAILLPQPLSAATLVCCTGSAAGKTSSLSPFGIVAPSNLSFVTAPLSTEFVGNDLCGGEGGCEVQVLDSNGFPLTTSTEVTLTLNKFGNSTGNLVGGTTASTFQFSSGEGAPFDGPATFFVSVDAPGTYSLTASAPGAKSVTSAQFTVEAGE
jgi:hypothetical protein